MARHGFSAYTRGGCRCDHCRAAMAAYRREHRRRVRGKVPPEVPHGLASTYQNYGCRCLSCREAATAASRYRRQERKGATQATAS